MTLRKGFTLIELLVVIGIIGILAAIVVIAVNPGRQFAQARDRNRQADILGVTNAIYQFAAEHDGNLPAVNYTVDGVTGNLVGDFPVCADAEGDDATQIGGGAGMFDIAAAGARETTGAGAADTDLIVPTYMAASPVDPSLSDYDTGSGYFVCTLNSRVFIRATGELTNPLSILR